MLVESQLAKKREIRNQKRNNQIEHRKKITKAELTRRAKQEYNDSLKYDLLKIIYELLTNIHNKCSKVSWNFIKEQNGIRLIFKQHEVGTTIDEVLDGLATSEKMKDEKYFAEKLNKAGGLFGTGISLIEYYALELFFKTNGESYNFKTDECIPYEIGDEVEIEMLIPITSHKVKYIESAKKLIEKTEFFIKSNKRTHNFIIDGFSDTENRMLATLIEKKDLIWKTPAGTQKDAYDYSVIDINGKQETETILPITIPRGINGDENHNVKLYDFQIGKLYNVPNSWGIVDTNKPFLILISKETNQILGIIPWTGSHPVSTNNSCIISYVSKIDLRWLFNSADKMDGFHPIAEKEFVDWMKRVLNKYYPDSNAQESAGQFFGRDIIVYDKIGQKPSDAFRTEIGVGWMNNLSPDIREKICKVEWASGRSRFDLHIFISKNGKINSSTKKIIGECKRKGYDSDAFNQLVSYIAQHKNTIGGIGLSIDIKDKHYKNFDKTSKEIQSSGQMANDTSFHLVDLLDYGFENYIKEYTDIALKEEKIAVEKDKKKAEEEKLAKLKNKKK